MTFGPSAALRAEGPQEFYPWGIETQSLELEESWGDCTITRQGATSMVTQATVRGDVVHFQQGTQGAYQKADIEDANLAARVAQAIIRGQGVRTSLYGSPTLYVEVSPPPAPQSGQLPDGSEIPVPSFS